MRWSDDVQKLEIRDLTQLLKLGGRVIALLELVNRAAAQPGSPAPTDCPGVAGSTLEGVDNILTVACLGLPLELRRSLACTNIMENMMGTIRWVSRNVKRWRNAAMALRWTAAGMIEAAKGFRKLKDHKQLPTLRSALAAHKTKHLLNADFAQSAKAA